MTTEQLQIQQYVDQLIKAGNVTILQRNSRAKKLLFGARLLGVVTAMFLPLALLLGCFATVSAVWVAFIVAFSL